MNDLATKARGFKNLVTDGTAPVSKVPGAAQESQGDYRTPQGTLSDDSLTS